MGGDAVNKAFRKHAENTFGPRLNAVVQEMRSRNIDSPINNGDDLLDALMDEFEEVKGSFSSGNNNNCYPLFVQNLPQIPGLPIDNQRYILHHKDMERIFATQLRRLKVMIHAQLDRVRKWMLESNTWEGIRILFVGGLSANSYITSQLKSYFERANVILSTPDREFRGTVSKGVTLAAFDQGFVQSQVLRRSYGVRVDVNCLDMATSSRGKPKGKYRTSICEFTREAQYEDLCNWVVPKVCEEASLDCQIR